MNGTYEKEYTIFDLSRLTGISDRTLRKYIREGKLDGELKSGRWLFRYEQIRSFISDPCMESTFKLMRAFVYSRYVSENRFDKPLRFVYLDIPSCDETTLRELIESSAFPSPIHGVTHCFYVSNGIAHLTYYGQIEDLLSAKKYVFNHYPSILRMLEEE